MREGTTVVSSIVQETAASAGRLEPSTVAPITCQPWCQDVRGHSDAIVAADHSCHGKEHRLPLGLEAPQAGSITPGYVTAYPSKNFHSEPSVFIGHGEEAGWHLTPTEARLLALELLLIVAQLDVRA
jgi:hypothetical protein